MKNTQNNLRARLALCTALTLAGGAGFAATAHAQSAPTPVMVPDTSSSSSSTTTPVIVPGEGTTPDLNAYQIEKVKILYKKLLLREKDIPNAVSELGPKEVKAANPTTGSIQTLLTQAPNVIAYSQQPGQDSTTLAIRGVRNDELAETLDGVPINNLLTGSGDYTGGGHIGSPVTLNEIDGVTIYEGLAPPDHQGFGTVGGTIAYKSKQPTDDREEEIEGGFGSFDTQHIGFSINTGKMGDGPDAPKALLLYDQSETAGYVENTPAKFHDFMFNIVKPYDNGLSKLGFVVIFNQGKALVQVAPSPVPLIQKYGYKFNYPISDSFNSEADQDLSVVLSDETYINKYAIFDGSLFFHHHTYQSDSYLAPDNTGYTFDGNSYATNVQGLYQFFGCVGAGTTLSDQDFTYDPVATFGSCANGESDSYSPAHDNTIGITPKLTLFPDDHNTVVIGGLLAKSTSGGATYLYGADAAAQNQDNGVNSFTLGGGTARTIFSAYAQDTIRLLDNKLQITPGVKVDAAYTDNIQQTVYGSDTQMVNGINKFQNFTKIGGYYLGGSYNLPDNFVVYGSLGKGSLFATTNYYSGGLASGIPGGTDVPTPEIVHLYEGGIRYDTPRLYLNLDYYYQAIADGFSFYYDYAQNTQFYGNTVGYLFRGVEGNAKYLVTPNFSVFGNFSFDKPEYTKTGPAAVTLTQDQFGQAFSGTPLSNVPDWTGLVGAEYDYGPFSLYATGQYTGREYTTYDINASPYGNTCYETSDPSVVITCDPTTPPSGYKLIPANVLDGATATNTNILNPANFLVNLLFTYKIPLQAPLLKSLTADLNIQNLFDTHYYTYTFSAENPVNGIYDPNLPGGQPYNEAFEGEPRSFTVDLIAKF